MLRLLHSKAKSERGQRTMNYVNRINTAPLTELPQDMIRASGTVQLLIDVNGYYQ